MEYTARRNERRLRRELSRTSTQPFEYPQGHESFDTEQSRGAQDRELVERLVERPVEWQMISIWWIRASRFPLTWDRYSA